MPPRDTSPIIPSIYYMSVVKMCGHSRSTGVSMLSIKRWLVHHLRGRCIVVIRGGLSSSRTNHCHWTVLQYTNRVYILLTTFRCGVVCCGGVMEAHNHHYQNRAGGWRGSNSLCDCRPVVDSTTWRLVHDRIINYYSIDMSCRVLDVVSHAKQTRRGLLYQIRQQLQHDENPPLASEQWPLDLNQTIYSRRMIYVS